MAAERPSGAKPAPSAKEPAASRAASAAPEPAPLRILADRDGIIREWNSQAEAIFGHAPEEAIGKSLDLIIPEHLRAAHWRGYEQAMATGHVRLGGKPILTRAVHKDGGKIYVEIAFELVRDGSGAVVGALATGRKAAKPGK